LATGPISQGREQRDVSSGYYGDAYEDDYDEYYWKFDTQASLI